MVVATGCSFLEGMGEVLDAPHPVAGWNQHDAKRKQYTKRWRIGRRKKSGMGIVPVHRMPDWLR